MKRILVLTAAILAAQVAERAQAHDNQVSVTISGGQRCITSNDTPNHAMGSFPTRGNPNRFQPQTVRYCIDATPADTGHITRDVPTSGISLTGIPFRPGTAEYYDASSRRGFSRDPSSGWHVEGMGAADMLGMDRANAHVDERGLYHYHAPAPVWTDAIGGSLIGYAADGFEIHYAGGNAKSSWQLISGTRPSGPRGRYDGTYLEDWEYVAGSGNLDQCNGATVKGQYTYFATDTYPFFPRCFRGTVSRDFLGRR